jgi:hypothetical protein
MTQRTPVFINLDAAREYWKDRCITAEKQRDELLAAGNRVITRFDARLDEERESILRAIDALREAIAKAQGDV